ncbi:arginine deiminase-related protein [Flavihumibacter rivuli]|uniref:citrulline utilization hydrolase CtlX n=1 Tax=Flavihumibacter rivuli TaxID=2838156 RepID=UPI001BDF162D|nr:arginine deiminase-related protein [Flavihumibacter rivuli]ULQ55724.1 arginine deiminase-related protein [Flavihumibacter rivuli]
MQAASSIAMIRPASFGFNPDTAVTNAFQKQTGLDPEKLASLAREEFDHMVSLLRNKDIHVLVLEDDPEPKKPDAVFPNNWFSLGPDGTLHIYPMQAASRQLEVREDLLAELSGHFKVKEIKDWRENPYGAFLEGTGSMIMDHQEKIIYAAISPRTDEQLLLSYASYTGYRAFPFQAADRFGKSIYHTNVLMALGTSFAILCTSAIKNEDERSRLIGSLEQTGHELIAISFDQMDAFAGNMLEVKNKKGQPFIAMSQAAFDSLTNEQRRKLSAHGELLPIPIPTIETIGGGSVRCMMAEIFAPEKE